MGKKSRKRRAAQATGAVREIACLPRFPVKWALLVGLLGAVAYLNTLGHDFVYDDQLQILRNPNIRDLAYVKEIFAENFWKFRGGTTNYYRPLFTLSYLLTYYVFGLNPWGFHLVNILLHALNTLLVFWLLWRIIPHWPAALAGGALFAVHPIHTESVAWVAGLTDVLCAFFFLLAFLTFDYYLSERKRIYLGCSVGTFGLALLSKELAITLPVLLLAYLWALRREHWKVWPVFGWYGLVIALYSLIRVQVLGAFALTHHHVVLAPLSYLVTLCYMTLRYVGKVLLPVNQNAYYVFDPIEQVTLPAFLMITSLTLLCAAFFLVTLWKKWWELLFGQLFFYVTLGPVLNITRIGKNVFADRYLYLPSIGLSLALAYLVFRLGGPRAYRYRNAVLVFVMAICGLGFYGTYKRNQEWKDELTLFERTVEDSPESADARTLLGNEYFRRGRLDEAEEQYRAALGTRNFFQRTVGAAGEYASAFCNLGVITANKGDVKTAEKYFLKSLELNPTMADSLNNLGVLYYRRGDLQKALEYYQRSLRYNYNNENTHYNIGLILTKLGRFDEARQEFNKALEIYPYYQDAVAELRKLDALEAQLEATSLRTP